MINLIKQLLSFLCIVAVISNVCATESEPSTKEEDKRAGGRAFLPHEESSLGSSSDKRGGARGFSVGHDVVYHSAERRGGGHAFMMPTTGDDLWINNKRAGGRSFHGFEDAAKRNQWLPFYEAGPYKRAGGRAFLSDFIDKREFDQLEDQAPEYEKRAGGRGFYNPELSKRAGGRAFYGINAFYPKRGGGRPFYASSFWPEYQL